MTTVRLAGFHVIVSDCIGACARHAPVESGPKYDMRMARPLRDRLVFELISIREELAEAVAPIGPGELDYSPAEGMRTYRGLMVEIGGTEAATLAILRSGQSESWERSQNRVTGDSMAELLASVDAIRQGTFAYLADADEVSLKTPITIPENWAGFLGARELEPEELIRWIGRHEYYHLGQIVSYRWAQGNDPYA
jgi:hypothetical protein